MPLSRTEGRQAFELARLADEPFRMVLNEVVEYQQAAVVGRLIPQDPDRQLAALQAIARFEPKNEAETVALVEHVARTELQRQADAAQGSMFGELLSAEFDSGRGNADRRQSRC